jgi:hypothetical protein
LPTGVTGEWVGNVITVSGTPSVLGTFNYRVNLTGGCGAISTNGNIRSISVPIVTSSIIGDGCLYKTSITATSSYSNFSWFKNNVQIAGENNNSFTPIEEGIYKVKVSDGICNGYSSTQTIFICGVTPDGKMAPTSSTNLATLEGAIHKNSSLTDAGKVIDLSPKVGDALQGGIVFYILQAGDPGYNASISHGLIAASSDQTDTIAWIIGGSTQTTLNSRTLNNLGAGQANSDYMLAQSGSTGGAAKICDEYSVLFEGVTYSDWYLPSKEELNKLYLNKDIIGGFINPQYWSSSEGNTSNGWCQYFTNGTQTTLLKSRFKAVRAIRSF